MPIYAYRCNACGHAQDVLQKMSDPRLTVCPECGKSTYEKQVTAAGFQLKGSGWYVTDFRNNGGSSSTGADSASHSSSHQAAPASGSSSTSSGTGSAPAAASAPAAPASGPASPT
ncbi:FmdB family zinc ribbon protein [Eoetvoesiella caeni]|uniref:FmdB family zinc ribbon protein n=1 Tax=Eoetvoesiella caeni TaxID=645616 RepID=UPI000DEB9DB4|nr:FmdB family zinc ribbon protein [Eoetvoesiella caeni]MCI2807857.1 zinc ribbon domain-containing protein [Eoetvoesiella caeni]NYT54141.1 zinc ribbon domain-containing protein [Eoetvoesiella caeni]